MMSDRQQLACLVQQWNENRLDLFHLSYPTEDLEIEGVMRFYFQDGAERVLTKCVRVSSTATTSAVVEALSEKFLPDLKMLSNDTYSLWEVHESGEERRLDRDEKPLLVQLMWHRDDREGRFLLRRDRAAPVPLSTIQLQEADARGGRFSKKKDREGKKKHQKEIVTVNSGREEATDSNDIYKQVPFNTFTRTISNPEVVMRKRREKKLETKLKEMVYGGSLKIYGGDIVPARPYVTILAGMHDRADRILVEALEKYGLEKRVDDFVLVECSTNSEPGRSLSDLREIDGRLVGPDECPLLQMAARAGENGFESYLAIKHRPSDYQVPSAIMRSSMTSSIHSTVSDSASQLRLSHPPPTLTLLNDDGTLSEHHMTLREGLTEVGSDLDGPEIRGRHAAIAYMDGVVTVTPSAPDAYLEVNKQRLMQTEILHDGDVLRIGADNVFKFACGGPQAQNGAAPSDPKNMSAVNESRSSNIRMPSDYGALQIPRYPYEASLSGSSVSSSRHPSEQVNAHSAFHQPLAYSNLPTTSTPVRLAISLQIGDYKVWDFLGEVMSRGWADCGTFRLAPAYALYLALRFFQSHTKAYLVQFFARIEANLKQIATNCSSRDELLFWMANASELSYLVDRDPDLRPRAGKLSVEVERVFRRLCTVLLGALRPCSRPMLDTRISDQDGSAELISLLDSTLRAARTSRLNAALTIQISGHMLHTVNAFIFNHLVGVGVSPVPLTTRLGKSLQARLASVHRWAEGMGVELAAECHLDRSRQAANLLAAQKNDVAALGATCYKLNSMQIRRFLSAFEHEDGEIPVDSDVINRIVRLAEKQADLLTKEDGQKITLEEPDELNLPFLIPQDGYTAELLTDVPEGLTQYLMKLEDRRVCHSVSLLDSNEQIRATSVANEHMNMSTSQNGANFQPPPPITRSASQTTLTSIPTTQFGDSFGSNGDDIIRVHLKRGNGGIGLSIVAAQGIGDRKMGIYVKKVVEGTPAAVDGRLCTGDQLLSVNGHSLLGISQEDAAKLMTNSGPEVSFEVRKGAAHRNGIGAWLNGTPTTPSTSGAGPPQYIPPSPAMSSTHAPPSYSNFSSSHGGSQQTVEAPPTYQQRYQQQQAGSTRSSGQPTAPSVRSVPSIPAQHYQQHAQHHQMHQTMTPSAVVEPLQQPQNLVHRHFRSNSASDLHQNDSNASYSQRSATNGAPSNFDKLPAHYRHSSRPTVIQPSRPGAVSPSALRRGAQSPSAISTNGFGGPLYRPSSASNLFAPPRSPNPLHGYSSNSARESNQDIYRASMAFDSPPAAQSSPREDKYQHYSHQADYSSYSASLPQPLNSSSPYQSRPSSMYGYSSQNRPSSTVTAPTYSQQQARANNSPPRVSVANSTTHVSHPTSSSSIHAVSRSQEPAVVRPMDLGMRREYTEERQTTSSGVMRGAVPTAITQALQLQQEKGLPLHPQPMRSAAAFRERGVDADLRQLERTNTALMSYEAVNDELDRLDMKGINMTEEETRRYRELLNVAAEQSRTRRGLSSEAVTHKPVVIHHRPLPVPASSSSASTSLGSRVRTETLIDDVSSSYQTVNGSATRENVSPNSADAHKIHYIDSDFLNINGKRDDVQLIDSPGIVGAHEIYRDPRQRRLNEIQERQQSQVPSSDGASLGFRDKQRLSRPNSASKGRPSSAPSSAVLNAKSNTTSHNHSIF